MTELIVRTESLGGSPLARAAMAGQLTEWYVARPHTPDEWRARAAAVRREMHERRWTDSLSAALDATGAAAERLKRVAAGRGIVVTTGQQPGLFGGPVYTWSKALSALALANEIERSTGIPTAPVFWAANDDADFAEASWTAVAVTGGAERIAVTAGAPLGRPMSEMPLGDPSAAVEALVRACGSTLDPRPIAAVRESYHAGATVGGAYLQLLRRLFEPLGIAVLDAAHEAVATAARPFLVRALERADDVAAALRDRDLAVGAAGFTPQVSEVAGLTVVFDRVPDGGEKRRVPITEAAAAAARRGGVLSPNVLLRPVIERALLPTVAYVAGPGEIAYFAQVSALASTLDLAAPLVVPRWSATILEPHVARILARLELEVADLADPHAAEGRLARLAISPALHAALRVLRRDLDRDTATVADASAESGLGLPAGVVDGVRRTIEHRIERLERRVVAAVKHRESDTMRQIATARGALYPLGTRQERALNPIPIMARHGDVVIERMMSGATRHARTLVGSVDGPEAHAPAMGEAGGSVVGAEPSSLAPDA